MKITINVSEEQLKEINLSLGDLGPITDKKGLQNLIEDLLSGVANEVIDARDIIL